MKRRLAVAGLISLLAACGGSTGPPPKRAPSIASVSISPAVDTADALGDTVVFEARALDPGGVPIPEPDLRFNSTRTIVATVDDRGRARAKADGSTRIVAAGGGHADTAILVVEQAVASVRVEPDSAALETAGDTVFLEADLEDANGVPVNRVPVSWSSSDPAVAAVDDSGRVAGRSAGRARITASAQGVEGTADVRVVAAPSGPPVLDETTPSPLAEEEKAVIRGSGFSPLADRNSVTVDGAEAPVDSATRGRLAIRVPDVGCVPPGPVEVEVRTSAGTAAASFPLEPEEPAFSLSRGRQAVRSATGDLCLQFGAAAAGERYLLGVQSLTATSLARTPVEIVARTADGDTVAEDPPARIRLRRDGGGVVPEAPGPVDRQRGREARLRAWERRRVDPAATLPARGPEHGAGRGPAAVTAAGVGDTVRVRVPDFGAADACETFTPVTAVVRAVGEHMVVAADTASPEGGFGAADYRTLADRADAYRPTLADYFGEPTDVDANGRVVSVFTPEVNRQGFLGFVFGADFLPRSGESDACASSDEGEIFYAAVPDPEGEEGFEFSREIARRILPATMVHELTHVIQTGRRFRRGAGFLSSVVAEGQAMIAEEVVGHAREGNAPGRNYGPGVALDPDRSDEAQWYSDGFADLARYFGFESSTSRIEAAPRECGWWQPDPSPCVGRSLWYGVGWSFLRWASDRFGPGLAGGEATFHRRIVDSDAAGLGTVQEAAGGVPVERMMARWAASLWVDDRVPGADPALEQSSWDLEAIQDALPETARLRPPEADFGDWSTELQVRASSSGYLLLGGGDGRDATALRVGGPAGSLGPRTQVWVVRLE